MKMKAIAAVLAAVAMSVCADQIKLNDGSVINGKVTKIADGKITVSTAFAGDVAVDAAKVTSIDTDEAVNIATATEKSSGKFVNGKLGNTELTQVKHLWKEGDADPTLPKGRKWKYEAEASIDGKTGNTEKCTVAGGIKATLAGPADKLLLYLRAKHARDNHVTNEKEVVGGADFERSIAGSNSSWYLRSEYEYDKINDLDPSITSAAGYGYYIKKEKDMQIRLRAGITHIYKEYVSDTDSTSDIGIEFNYHHEINLRKLKFTPLAVLITDISYLPVFEEPIDDYRIYHESSISFPLNTLKSLSLRLGVSNDYYSQVADDKKHLDTCYFAKLVLTWGE